MSITNYAELQAAIGNWLNRSDLSVFIPDFIILAESRIYRELRVRAMELSFSGTISAGVIAVPSSYVAWKFAYVNVTPVRRLTVKEPGWIYEYYPNRVAEGVPNYIAREGDNFIFGPYPDSSYAVNGIYYQRLDALSNTNTTNWFITNAPDLLLFASLMEAAPFLKQDDRIAVWMSKYQDIKTQIQSADKAEKVSGSPLVVTVSNR